MNTSLNDALDALRAVADMYPEIDWEAAAEECAGHISLEDPYKVPVQVAYVLAIQLYAEGRTEWDDELNTYIEIVEDATPAMWDQLEGRWDLAFDEIAWEDDDDYEF